MPDGPERTNFIQAGGPFMNKMLLLFMLMATPFPAQTALCTPGSGTCITPSEDKNVFLHATCDDDGALLISLEAPQGRVSGDDIHNRAGQDGGGWTCASGALRGHCNILYARVPGAMLDMLSGSAGREVRLSGALPEGRPLHFSSASLRLWAGALPARCH
ncbi:hypothetical protein [Pantoea sp. SM3]|uniref:hypothetical protein n=1 Tax=Pantoea sp. SM3 TaxID=1628192 RepID=UPI0005F7C30B|nr:hypothetical protein [Pantoea sp. SM3]KJV27630.1 hypothetical protein VI01_19270 [Pantoea sp. SM3]